MYKNKLNTAQTQPKRSLSAHLGHSKTKTLQNKAKRSQMKP